MNIKYHFCWKGKQFQLWTLVDENGFKCISADDAFEHFGFNIFSLPWLHEDSREHNWQYKDYETYDNLMKEHFLKLL